MKNEIGHEIGTERFSLDEFWWKVDHGRKLSRRKAHWLMLMMEWRLTCPVSWAVVSYFTKDYDNVGWSHYNFYSENDELFTIDHIRPLGKGWTHRIDNIQPMLYVHNFNKWDKYDEGWKKGKEKG